MHPAFIAQWKAAHREAHLVRWHHVGGSAAGPEVAFHGFGRGHGGGFHGGGTFGVRRPLRYLAYKLELDEDQVEALAGVLDDIKTERAQAAVDDRRVLKRFAEAVAGEKFDLASAQTAASDRAASTTKVQDVLVDALARIHSILDSDQRARFAYLIRTGSLTL